MTEVPEYLLERSRARRAALGLGGAGPSADAPSPDAGGGASTGEGAGMVATPAASAPPATGSETAPAGATATEPAPAATATLPTYIADPGPKSGIPVWMMPVLLMLPLWAIVYMGAFGEQASSGPKSPLELGEEVYAANCASCHGPTGGGGSGPKLAGGEAKLTFADEAAHVEWVENGSATRKGQPYGDPGRAGGQRTAKTGGMPGFKGKLTDEEIKGVVAYEREGL